MVYIVILYIYIYIHTHTVLYYTTAVVFWLFCGCWVLYGWCGASRSSTLEKQRLFYEENMFSESTVETTSDDVKDHVNHCETLSNCKVECAKADIRPSRKSLPGWASGRGWRELKRHFALPLELIARHRSRTGKVTEASPWFRWVLVRWVCCEARTKLFARHGSTLNTEHLSDCLNCVDQVWTSILETGGTWRDSATVKLLLRNADCQAKRFAQRLGTCLYSPCSAMQCHAVPCGALRPRALHADQKIKKKSSALDLIQSICFLNLDFCAGCGLALGARKNRNPGPPAMQQCEEETRRHQAESSPFRASRAK